MINSRLNKILELLESRNRILRSEAISTLMQYAPISQQKTMYSWDQLFDVVTQCFRSSLWECRIASAELFFALLENADKAFHEHFELLLFEPLDKIKNNFDECATLIEKLNLCQIESDYKVLVGFDECNTLEACKNKILQNANNNQKKKQRQLIDQHLDMNSATGVSSRTFITDDEIVSSSEIVGANSASSLNCQKELYDEVSIVDNETSFLIPFLSDFSKFEQNIIKSNKDAPNSEDDYAKIADNESDEQKMSLPRLFLQSLCLFFQFTLLRDLVNPRWQTRHGAALVLTQICNHAEKWLFLCPGLLTAVTTRLLHLLCMDRFCDFVTGSNVVAPVREAAAQALSFLLLKLCDCELHKNRDQTDELGPVTLRVSTSILNQICNMLQMTREQNWHCRQAALLVAKYYFAVTTFLLPSDYKLFDLTLCALERDPVDEIISASSQAVCSFFLAAKSGIAKFNVQFLAKIRQETLPRLWQVLQHPERLSQLREGVDSVLVDLLGLLEFWLCTKLQVSQSTSQPSIQLNANQITILVELLECSPQQCPTERNIKVLQCLCSTFEHNSLTISSNYVNEQIWTEKLVFQTLKRLYRCVLFCPPTSAEKLISYCQTTLQCLLEFFRRHMDLNSISNNLLGNDLALNIGLWISCLMYEHRNSEIDVFLHNVDGLGSQKDRPKELLCGGELHFMDKRKIDTIILERKAMAAAFLAPLIDALFLWGRPILQQSMSVSVQLLFFPYLRSNSLYQKLGSALLAEGWSTVYHKNLNRDNRSVPDLLIKELYEQLSNNINSSKLFDETAQLVNVLTRECNEFKQYCLRKGVPFSELLPLNQVTSMEEAVNSAYRSCENLLEQEDDLRALTARHSLIIELIEDTRLATRTYASRINFLFSSALLNFVDQTSLPVQLTPLIKPLIDAIEFENSMYIVSSQLVNAFFTLIKRTSNRKPCPHSKVLRQLFLGLGHCDQWSPKALNWDELSVRHVIISLENSVSTFGDLPRGIKTRNCVNILKSLCERCGKKIDEIFPEMINGNICSLDILKEDNKPEEEFLLRLDFYGVIFSAIIDKKIRLSIIKEKICSKISCIMLLLSNSNPAVRFRVARFLANLTEIELCSMLSLIFQPLSQMISDTSTEWARFGALEFLLRISNIGSKLLGAVSLLSPLALRCIGDRNESVRVAAASAFRQFVTLLPLENKQKHFLHELFNNFEEDKQSAKILQTTYLNSFSLVDVLGCPGNLPRLKRGDIPSLVDTLNLREYQIEGITWLSFLGQFGLNGILADDMGLGKTLQVLSLLSWDYAQRRNKSGKEQSACKYKQYESSLIVCPRTLIDHWCKEWKSYFPFSQIHIQKLNDFKERHSVINNGNRERILVISYEELRSNRVLCDQNWHYVVLDEGHCIRNPASQLFETVCSLKCSHRLILSGTPVQNSPADLWALFTFLMPGYLSSRAAFHSKFIRHIMACRNQRSNEQQIKDGEQALQSLHKQCLPFVLRRLKTEVLTELPEKVVQDRECELSDLQRHLYQLLIDFCSLNVRDDKCREKHWLTPIQILHALRKLVDHPFLIAKLVGILKCEDANFNHLIEQCMQLNVEHSGKMLALRELLNECQIGETCIGEIDSSCSVDRAVEVCQQPVQNRVGESKADQCITSDNDSTLTSSICQVTLNCRFVNNAQHKALIFCQWRATIELISHFLKSGAFGIGINFLLLDGQTPLNQRQSIVDRFNTDPNVQLLILTTHVGGIGLNLTGADVVIFVDHDWNPFRDLQAIDRAHRLGQNRTVNVFRLITTGTVEEKVMNLQRFKENTANALIGVENRSIASMATDELLELFSLKRPESNLEVNSKMAKVKKSRMSADASRSSETGVWAVDELWGDQKEETDVEFEQYIEQHSVHKFLHSTVR